MPGEDFHLSVMTPLQAHIQAARSAVTGAPCVFSVAPCDPVSSVTSVPSENEFHGQLHNARIAC